MNKIDLTERQSVHSMVRADPNKVEILCQILSHSKRFSDTKYIHKFIFSSKLVL